MLRCLIGYPHFRHGKVQSAKYECGTAGCPYKSISYGAVAQHEMKHILQGKSKCSVGSIFPSSAGFSCWWCNTFIVRMNQWGNHNKKGSKCTRDSSQNVPKAYGLHIQINNDFLKKLQEEKDGTVWVSNLTEIYVRRMEMLRDGILNDGAAISGIVGHEQSVQLNKARRDFEQLELARNQKRAAESMQPVVMHEDGNEDVDMNLNDE